MHSLNVEISLLCGCLFFADTQVFSYLPLLQNFIFSLGHANKRKTISDKINQQFIVYMHWAIIYTNYFNVKYVH
jgi:hypothetical protein